MHRFYLSPEQCHPPTLTLSGREAHHALHVLRVRAGDAVIVLDGAGREFTCDVDSSTRDALTLRVKEQRTIAPLPCAITLVQAIPKGKIIESIIQKATELGAARVVPLLSERVITHLDGDSAASKAEKWQQVAVEAIKQSCNAWLPRVEVPVTPTEFLSRSEKPELFLIGSLRGDARHPREQIERFLQQHQRPPKTACVWVGPEGDFTAAELDAAQAAGALPISLGRLVLRSETAATYCLAVLAYEMQWLAR